MVVLIGRFRNILLLHELIIIDIAQKMGFYTCRKWISNWQKVTKCSKSENKRLTNCSVPTIYKLQNVANSFMEVAMLKISLKEGQYVNIGDDIRVVYVGRSGSNGKLMIEAPKELRISRSVEDVDGKKYYADPKLSIEAQNEIKQILKRERLKNGTR